MHVRDKEISRVAVMGLTKAGKVWNKIFQSDDWGHGRSGSDYRKCLLLGDLYEASHPIKTSRLHLFEGSSSSVCWNPNKNAVLECQQATVRLACLGISTSISPNLQRIFKPTQALNLFASIQQNAPHWVRELQVYVVILLGIWGKCYYNSISFTPLKFI